MDNINWKVLLEQLSQPFQKDEISWRAGATSRDKKRAQALAYAEPRTYEDRLNQVCPGDWSVKFLPWGETRLICELTIHGVSRSSTGEFDSEKRNAIAEGTVAEAQAFKRTCSKFGLGRYLYDLPLMWVEYDEEKGRLKDTPEIPAKYLPGAKPNFNPINASGEVAYEVGPTLLSPERAAAMSSELVKIGYPKNEQARLASSVLERPIKDLVQLTDTEAFEVWSYAKKVHRNSQAPAQAEELVEPVDSAKQGGGIGVEAGNKLKDTLVGFGWEVQGVLRKANQILGTGYASLAQVTEEQMTIVIGQAKAGR